MNVMLVSVVILLAVGALWGFYRGFLLMVYSLAAWLLSMVIVYCAVPVVTQNIIEGTDIDDQLQSRIVVQLRAEKGEEDQGDPEEALEIGGIRLPDTVSLHLQDPGALGQEVLDGMGVYDRIAALLTRLIISGCCFVVVLFVVRLALALAGSALKLISKIKGVRQVNQFLGAILGLTEGLLILWIVFAIFALISTTDTGKGLTEMIYSSPVLTLIYENDPVTALVGSFL